MEIKLDIHPISVNKIWKGRRFSSKDYQNYESEVGWLLSQKDIKKVEGWIEIEYQFYLKRYKTTDTGNLEKPLTDILVKHKIIDDDRFVKRLVLEKFQSKTEYVIVKIKPYEK